jgi:hypothetical protein
MSKNKNNEEVVNEIEEVVEDEATETEETTEVVEVKKEKKLSKKKILAIGAGVVTGLVAVGGLIKVLRGKSDDTEAAAVDNQEDVDSFNSDINVTDF